MNAVKMARHRDYKRIDTLLALLVSMLLSGCGQRGAPSFVLFGAYFPAWMLCALIGITGAIAARSIFVASGLSGILPLQLLVCTAIGACVALLTWLFWFGH